MSVAQPPISFCQLPKLHLPWRQLLPFSMRLGGDSIGHVIGRHRGMRQNTRSTLNGWFSMYPLFAIDLDIYKPAKTMQDM